MHIEIRVTYGRHSVQRLTRNARVWLGPLAQARNRRVNGSVLVKAERAAHGTRYVRFLSREEQEAYARSYQDASRRQSGRSASSSGRWANTGEEARSKSSTNKGSTQRAQTWSRQWEAPLPSRRRAQWAPVSQRGPVQPATWTDRSPGGNRETSMNANEAETRSQPSQARPPAADAFANERQRRSTAVTPESDNAVLPASNGSGYVRAPPTSDRLETAASATSIGPTRINRTGAGNQRRRRGLWGRDVTPEGPTIDSPSGPSTYVNDWGEMEASIAETEDGWGSTMEERKRVKEREGSPARPGAIRSDIGGTIGGETGKGVGRVTEDGIRRETGESVGSEPGDKWSEGSGAAAAQSPAEDYRYSSEETEILDEPDAFDDAELDEGPYPDITLLAPSEVDEMLPVVPTAEQLGSSWGSAVDVWQRLGAAAFVTLISAKLNMFLFASGSATYPFWGPALKAANRNRSLRKKGRHVGFWRTSVLEVEVQRPQRRRYTDQTVAGPVMSRPMVRFLLGDDSGARSQLTLPFNRRYEQIQEGEPVELLVLSMQSNFSTFKARFRLADIAYLSLVAAIRTVCKSYLCVKAKLPPFGNHLLPAWAFTTLGIEDANKRLLQIALKEFYLPVSGLWLSEYPHVNRNLFLDISLDIERARKREMAGGAFETTV